MSLGRNSSRHTRDAVVDMALRLLDADGLADLTMRRLANALDVQPSALYWHVENKQTLLAAVADRIQAAARPTPPAELGWHEATIIEAVAMRDALLAYRDGAEVALSTRALGLGSDEAHRRLAAALERGHSSEVAQNVATALLHLVFGDASLTQQRIQADALGVVSPSVALRPGGGRDDSDAFRLGLDLLLSGLAHRLAEPAEVNCVRRAPGDAMNVLGDSCAVPSELGPRPLAREKIRPAVHP